MIVLAIEKSVQGVPATAFSENLLKEEAARAWELHKAGKIRELYFRADRRQAVLVFECSSVEQTRTLLATLPLVNKGLIDFEIIPLAPYTGFERLFHLPSSTQEGTVL
jgi:muconolactone delta-isomerase